MNKRRGVPGHTDGAGNVRPRLLDLFCCQGGASMGYHRAGFDVVGVDINPQPHYPFDFVQADALEYLAEHGHEFDAIHASPPCQAHTKAQRIMGNEHEDFIPRTRLMLYGLNWHRTVNLHLPPVPWVIENVPDSPLLNPVVLCGAMFGIGTYRHRLFESNRTLRAPEHPEHTARHTKMGRPPKDGEFMHIVGNFSGADQAREIMGMPWATRDGLREAIPAVYTEWIGTQLLDYVRKREGAV